MQMKYPDAWRRVRTRHYKRILVAITLSIIDVIITVIPQTRLLGKPMAIITTFAYIHLLNINFSRLRKALLQYAYERLVQYGNNRVELSQLKRYKVLSTSILIGLCFIAVCILMDELLFQVTSILYFGKCYIPLIYNIPYTPILHSTQQQLILFQVNKYRIKIITVFYLLSTAVFLIPITIQTCVIIVHMLYTRFIHKERTRYNYDSLKIHLFAKDDDC